MNNNQIDPSKETDQLSDQELEQVAGGTVGEKLDSAIDATKDFVGDVVDAGKDLISDIIS